MRVVELREDSVLVDANHPLAGVTLHYSVEVREVRQATDEEIEAAASDFEDARHVHGEDCDHDHGPASPEESGLVTLGKKPNLVN